jgi:nitrous oxidase accessory protein
VIKRFLVIGIILSLVCMSITPSFAFDNVKKSTIPFSDGNILYVGGNGTGNYTKIQDAINDAENGDTVFVYDDSSPYYEWNITIDKSINLIGEDKNTTIIDGNYQGNVVVIQSDYVTVNGFKIINCVMENETKYVIYLLDSKNVVIKDNIISVGENFPIYGIYGIGIFIDNSSYNLIQNNIIFKEGKQCVTRGISVIYPSDYNNYSGNEIYGYSYGIHTKDSDNNVFYANNIHHNFWGMVIEGISDYIINNKINNNEYSGIVLHYCRNFLVYGNTITYNDDDGIVIDCCTSFNIISNNILNNKPRGIYIYNEVFSSGNNISKNNFFNNGKNAYLINILLPVKIRWYNNYWGRPRILPKIIFGSLRIIIGWYLVGLFPWFNIDLFPAKEPYDIPT